MIVKQKIMLTEDIRPQLSMDNRLLALTSQTSTREIAVADKSTNSL